MASYAAAGTPKGGEAERYNALVQETSKAIGAFNQATRSITQKMSLFGTPQDSRANHLELKELSDKGNKLVTKINRRLQDLTKLCTGPAGRTRKTQVNKLASDFKNQCKAFEDVCQRLVEQEKTAVAHIRRSSSLVRHEDAHGLGDYSEDQIYAQANVTSYDEDDLIRREEDILHINKQITEVNAAFKEVDQLVTDQGEVVVQIDDDTELARNNAQGALSQVREADLKRGFCACSKTKLICWAIFLLVVVVLVLGLVMGLK